MDDLYFVCDTRMFKYLSDLLGEIVLPLRARYVFCCAPIDRRMTLTTTMYSKVNTESNADHENRSLKSLFLPLMQFATQFSLHQPITYEFVAKQCEFPLSAPKTLSDLIRLEQIFDILDLYMWFSYRFIEMFPEGDKVKAAQLQLDQLIQNGVQDLTKILKCLGRTAEGDGTAEGNRTPIVEDKVSVSTTKTTPDGTTLSGPMTAHVLSQGIISAAVLKKLHEEWRNDSTTNQRADYRKHVLKSMHTGGNEQTSSYDSYQSQRAELRKNILKSRHKVENPPTSRKPRRK